MVNKDNYDEVLNGNDEYIIGNYRTTILLQSGEALA